MRIAACRNHQLHRHAHVPADNSSGSAAAKEPPARREREKLPDLGLLMRRKNVDHAIDRLNGAVGVESRENQVTRFGHGQRHFDRFDVAQLADQNEVRVLTQNALERGSERSSCPTPTSR